MPLLKGGAVVDDPWVAFADDAATPPSGPVIVSHARWLRERDALRARNGDVGVALPNATSAADIVHDLDRLALVTLEFPKFSDGRAYSQARLLRERYAYRGELRATGRVLRDQLLFMVRCGFDAFEIAHDDPVAAWEQALAQFTVFYQPTGDGRPTAMDQRRAENL
jgi:uncharacterized protein (DUF934 family)